jgi:N-acetylmuramic acid 6-phosphate etherase
MQFIRTTEQDSLYNNLELKSIKEIITDINNEDSKVHLAVQKALPQIEALIEACAIKMLAGGRLFYIGAGTSGRLGILDASECPPTYGVPAGLVVGIIAGGSHAIQNAVENAEDDTMQGFVDLQAHNINSNDFVVGIAASGTTPYVIQALKACQQNGILTGSISCNAHAPLSAVANYAIECVVGPEYVTGSSRMKSGTAQKLILNIISTTLMIQLGRVEGNKMVNMQLTNEKLVDRGVHMLMNKLNSTNYQETKALLIQHGSVKNALQALGLK